MKIWFDRQDVSYSSFISEQFLLLPLFQSNVIKQNQDFKNSDEWVLDISKTVKYTKNVEDCDVIVYPNKLSSNIKKYYDISLRASKRVLCFYNDDNDISTCLPSNIDVYRTSFYNRSRKLTEYSLPAWSCDFLKLTDLNYRAKNLLPTIGFCGALTHSIRRQCIEILSTNSNIVKNFNIRNNFWGGSIHNQHLREEYVSNMQQSDLILCCRGAGNFSYRLYESMSLGKIPIIVNTDIVLPCDDSILWKDIGIWVDDISNINELITTYWDNITTDQYYQQQSLNREIYTKYLTPSGFARYLNKKYTKYDI